MSQTTMAQLPGYVDTPSEVAESLSHEQKRIATGINQLTVLYDSSEICQCDSTEPSRTTGREPGDKPGDVRTSLELTSTSGTFDKTVTGSGDIPESYEIIHSEAREMDSSWSIIDQDNENIRNITSTTSELPVTGGEKSAGTEVNAEVMTNTTDGRPLAAVQPSVFRESESQVTSEPSVNSTQQLLSQGDSTSGPGQLSHEDSTSGPGQLSYEDSTSGPGQLSYEDSTSGPGQESGARSQDVQSESGGVISSTSCTPKQEIDILLIGKTGHGKSSTGNSILRRNEFKTSSKGTSSTYNVNQAWTETDDYIVKVIDGPGVAETRLESAEAAQKACDDMAKAMSLCPKGFHALLLVLKFGERFTREEEDCIAMLKSIFGPNIVRDYCVVVVTHGELFDMDDDYDDFSDWLQDQDGAQKKLFIECKYRCLLMRNKLKNDEVKEKQLNELLQAIHTLKNREVRYTNELFDSVQQHRDRLIVEVKAPVLKEEIMRDINLIFSDFTKLKDNNDDQDETDAILLQLEERVTGLLERIEKEDNQTGVLIDLKSTVSKLRQSIQNEKAINAQRNEARKIQDQLTMEHEERMEELKLKHAEEKRKLDEQFKNATEAEREELKEQLRDISESYEERMNELISIHNQNLEQTDKEARRWQALLDQTKKDHDQQMTMLQSQYKEMEKTNAETMKENKALADELKRLQRTRRPPKDPTKVTLHCRDANNRIVSVPIPKNSPIKPLMQAYCGLSGYRLHTVRFLYDGKVTGPHLTPNDLKLEEDDMLEVHLQQEGGFYLIIP